MIVLDIETSGLDPVHCGIWQIGAIELENPENVFFEEARIDDEDSIELTALEISGINERLLRDTQKQSEKQLLENFLHWIEKIQIKNCICQNPQFDLGFIFIKLRKYDLINNEKIIPHRAFDLHSIASLKYFSVHGKFLIQKGKSDMGLTNILQFCGMPDNRKAHNAIEDARLTAECFSRIVFGKKLLKEFDSFQIPDYLENKNEKLVL